MISPLLSDHPYTSSTAADFFFTVLQTHACSCSWWYPPPYSPFSSSAQQPTFLTSLNFVMAGNAVGKTTSAPSATKTRPGCFCFATSALPNVAYLIRLQRVATSCCLAELRFFGCGGEHNYSCSIQRGTLCHAADVMRQVREILDFPAFSSRIDLLWI